jgi:hypothetical protein
MFTSGTTTVEIVGDAGKSGGEAKNNCTSEPVQADV